MSPRAHGAPAKRVGLNLLHLVPGETGGAELYARRLIPAMVEARPELELVLFAPREAAPSLAEEPWADSVEIVQVPVNARSRVRRVAAEQTLLPGAVRRASVDLLHNVFTTAPVLPGAPQVTTILDVIYKRIPHTHAGLFARGLTLLVPFAAWRSRRVITLSHAAKEDIVRYLGVEAERIDVTHLGPGMPDAVDPLPEEELRRGLGLGDAEFVLSVSAKRPHKNLERLIEAVAGLGPSGPSLVIPGYPTPFEHDLRQRAVALGAGERIRFTGWVDEPTLEALYRSAVCFVFPSLVEGFGLPVLEAMLRGTPVACSNTSSLPEIAGDAARYFDPTDSAEIAAAIGELLGNPELRARLAEAGRERARRFTWEQTAASTLASYDRALGADA